MGIIRLVYMRYPLHMWTSLCLAAAMGLAVSPIAAEEPSCDIAYIWHNDQAKVAAYGVKVSGILGPDVGRRLRVVRSGGNYGLVYLRGRGRGPAEAVAKTHTRLLTVQGLEPAVPVKTQNWVFASRKSGSDSGDTPLESKVDAYIKQLRRRGIIKPDENTAWSVYDLSDDVKLASINEDMSMDAASLVKPFIALAYLHNAVLDRRGYSGAVRRRMEDMIQNSDNDAANWFMRRLGGPAAVQRLLERNYGGIFRNLRLVEYIPRGGRTYRNKASAHDYSRFLYALWNGTISSSGELKRLMSLPKRNRLYNGAQDVPPGTEVYSKTGTTSRLCGDMGILVARGRDGKRYPYIIIGVIQKTRSARSYSAWMRERGDVIRRVSNMVYEEISCRHQLGNAGPLSAESPKNSGGNNGSAPVKL